MFVCFCKAVTDRTVHAAIAAGARTPRDVARACTAGSGCGGCWPALAEMIEQVNQRAPSEANSAA